MIKDGLVEAFEYRGYKIEIFRQGREGDCSCGHSLELHDKEINSAGVCQDMGCMCTGFILGCAFYAEALNTALTNASYTTPIDGVSVAGLREVMKKRVNQIIERRDKCAATRDRNKLLLKESKFSLAEIVEMNLTAFLVGISEATVRDMGAWDLIRPELYRSLSSKGRAGLLRKLLEGMKPLWDNYRAEIHKLAADLEAEACFDKVEVFKN